MSASRALLLRRSPLFQQRRGLASAILLSKTRETLEKKTVNELKKDLRERGLSTTGKREALISRLAEHHDYSTVSSSPLLAVPSSPSQSRPLSTSAPAAAQEDPTAPKQKQEKWLDPATGKPLPRVVPFTAPSVPSPDEIVGNVKLPGPREEAKTGVTIPYIPEKFDSSLSQPDDFPTRRAPRLIHTSADITTHHAGKEPSEAHSSDSVLQELEKDSSEAVSSTSSSVSRFFGGLWSDLVDGGVPQVVYTAQENLDKAVQKGEGVLKSLEERTGVKLSSSGSSSSSDNGKGNEWKFEERSLSDEEKTGLYGLAAIVAVGWLIGGPGKEKKHEKQKKHKEEGKAFKEEEVKPVPTGMSVSKDGNKVEISYRK
ncbi:hypothetical protein BT69DRAFT_1082750 [Atractiella rhizophila]|nr:hypothetical protein BT69DRAFT_1082750 [Atractiella rhizophila]